MIFTPTLARKIVAGRKTETRRPVDPDARACRYRIGRTYSIQGRANGPSLGRLQILAIDKQNLGDITYESARREGFRTRDEFRAQWEETYGHYDTNQPVWVILFALVADEPRLLHRDSSHGYTNDARMALKGEPEAVPPTEIALYNKSIEARERFRTERLEEHTRREARKVTQRIKHMATELAKKGQDPMPMLAQIEAALTQTETDKAA